MGILDGLKSLGGGTLQGMKDLVGANQKAYLEIADFTNAKVKVGKAQKPAAGNGALNNAAKSGFNLETLNSYASSLSKVGGGATGFADYKGFKKYRFECQFNPEEISISGYGGEELPIQNYTAAEGQPSPRDKDGNLKGSHMAAAKNHIDMNFKLVFDKVNIQDAFYSDKFTLSATNIGKGIGTTVSKVVGKSYSVQPEVEALTAIVRDNNKRLARFVWGDMIYEGVINSVGAEYVMFNVNGEPCRAFVTISMILYDAEVAGANPKIWKDKYMNEVYTVKSGNLPGADEVADHPEGQAPDPDDFSGAFNNLFA